MPDANDRLKAVAHYVIARSHAEKLGATKLNKVLWYSDIFSYRRYGKTITGADTYEKRQYGPVPKNIYPTIDALKKEEKIATREVLTPAGPRREFLWLEEPRVDAFTPQEVAILHEVIDWICDGESAASISEKTHDALWEETELGGAISVRAAAVFPAEITPDAVAWAKPFFKDVGVQTA